jgi:zinc protease
MKTHKILVSFLFLLTPLAARAVEVDFERDTALPLVHLNIAVRAGSVTDPAGKLGLTDFMAHMLLRGTRSRSKEQIDLALDQLGAQLEVETRAESIVIRGATLAEKLPQFLGLITEILTEPSFPESEIRKLKSETISGILDELSDDASLAGRRFNPLLFQGHPFGNSIDGTQHDVSSFTRDAIATHYDRLFRDGALVVLGSGDAKPDEISKWAKALGAARPGKGVARAIAKPTDLPSRRLELIDKPDRTQSQIMVGQIGVKMTDPEFFPLTVANQAFGGASFESTLMRELREKRGWTYGAYASFRHGTQPRSWAIHLYPGEKDTAPALALTLSLISDLAKNGLKKEDFAFAKRTLINSAGFMYNTPRKRVENKLLEKTIDLPEGFMKSYGPEIQKVTLEESNAALRNFVRPDRLAIAVVATASRLKEALVQAASVSADRVEVVDWAKE